MATNPSATPQGRPSTPGHEPTDAGSGVIFGIVFFLAVGGIALHFVVAGVQNVFEKQPMPTDRWPAVTQMRMAATAWTNRLPPLQVNPPIDLTAFRAQEEARLSSYGWVDRTGGVVHIPIQRAIDLLAEKGLPTRHGTNPPATGPSSWELQQQRARKE